MSTQRALVTKQHEQTVTQEKFRVVNGILEKCLDRIKSVLEKNQLPEDAGEMIAGDLRYTGWKGASELCVWLENMERDCMEYTKQVHEDRVVMQAENARLRDALERCYCVLQRQAESSRVRLVSSEGDAFLLPMDTLKSFSPFFSTALDQGGFVEGQKQEITFSTCQTKALQFVVKAIVAGAESNADTLTLDMQQTTKSLLVDIYNVSEMLLVPWVTQTAVRCCLEHADVSCSLIMEVIKVCKMLVTAHSAQANYVAEHDRDAAALQICAFARQKHKEAVDKLAARVRSITLEQVQDGDDECAQIFLSW